MNTPRLSTTLAVTLLALVSAANADPTLISTRVTAAPQVDGDASDEAWRGAAEVTTRDPIANINIRLRSVHTADELFMLVRFDDYNENREHKTQRWQADKGLYTIGPRREDTFVIKWNMEPLPVDITLSGDEEYKADIWYWKAFRTDHAGYADDKYQIYSSLPSPHSQRLISRSGKSFFLSRKGDAGSATYQNHVPIAFEGESISGYRLAPPSGSRADVRAKGVWQNGVWTMEFSRKLTTGHLDDIQLQQGGHYRFGVSRYEIAGRASNPQIEIPDFGSGEISEHLILFVE